MNKGRANTGHGRRERRRRLNNVAFLFVSVNTVFCIKSPGLINNFELCVFIFSRVFPLFCQSLHVAWCWIGYRIRNADDISAIIRHFKWPFASRMSQADKDWLRTLWTGMLNVNLLTNILPLAQLIYYICERDSDASFNYDKQTLIECVLMSLPLNCIVLCNTSNHLSARKQWKKLGGMSE